MAANLAEQQLKAKDYKSDVVSDWCPGCGDFGIVNAAQQALAELQIPRHEMMFYSGVGCSSKSPHFMRTYGVHTLHGRSLPFAQGSKLANPDLKVIITGGDGDGYGIGAGHFLNAGRRNVDMTYIVYDNGVYGLTKGQASPTLKLGMQTKSLPMPNTNDGINPLAIAISCGYTFVARSYAFDAKHLKKTLIAAINHKGLALVDVLQPCPTYNNLHTKDWYAEEVEVQGTKLPRTYDIAETGYDGRVNNPNDIEEVTRVKNEALQLVQANDPRIGLGVYYQCETPDFLERLKPNIPMLQQYASCKMPIADANGRPTTDLSEAYKEALTTAY